MVVGLEENVPQHQRKALGKFRENLRDVLQPKHDDYFLLRFLRARDFDLKKSECMLRETLAWRQQWQIDTLLDDYEEPEVIKKYLPGGLVGLDKEGCPVYIDCIGLSDPKGLLQSAKKTDILRKLLFVIERNLKILETESKKRGKRVAHVVLINDLEKFGLKHMYRPALDVRLEIIAICENHYPELLKHIFIVNAIDVQLDMISVSENNYPELLNHLFVINAPRIFPVVYNIVKPLLSDVTKRKIKILGSNFSDELLKHIDADQLPVCYGGTMTDELGDPRCGAIICQGGLIPKHYYKHKAVDADMTAATVGRGSSLQIDFTMERPGGILRWEFQTESFDIGFGVYRRTAQCRQKVSDMREVLANQRVNSHLVAEDGSVHCHDAGTYVIRFDNTYSWGRPKKLYYRIEALESDGIDQSNEGAELSPLSESPDGCCSSDDNSDDDDDDDFFTADEE